MRLLLVEDDRMIGEGVQKGLRQDGFSVDWVQDGRSAELALQAESYDCVLLDYNLPGVTGLDVLARIRVAGLRVPVVVFTDGDPWSYRIFASIAYGAIKSAHLSEHLVTPTARFLGVQPSDIVDYNLSTDKLTDQDLQALRSELTDPRFATPYWDKQIRLQLDLKKKAEQQAFAGKGLDYVTKTYLPQRLSEMGII